MHTTRDHHTATLLPNGKVLVAGGYRSTSAELFDPGNGTWSVTGSLTFARQFHTATLLPNGKVLVAGGEDGYNGHPASAELFDPGTGTWSVTGSLAFPRTFHTSTLLPNGKVLVTGGGGFGNLTSAELYDPATGTWSITGSLSTARASHTATLLPNGKVLVAGGSSQSDIYNVFFPTSTELYDPATGSWSASGNLNLGLASHTATLLSDGKVLVAGGYGIYSTSRDAESYDPATGSWSDAGGLATSREYHTATLLPNGKVLLTGGRGYSGVLDSAELYDPASGSSSLTDSLATTREFHTATLLLNGKVLIAGGNNLDNSLASAELFNPNPVTQPPFIVTQPQTRTNNIGTTATFKVVVSGNEPLSFQWRKEGTNLVNNGNTSGVTTTNLTISNVQFTNAGNYTVVITNSFGGMTSSVAVLVVTLSPDALALANALDNTSFAWSNSGVANWFAQTNVTHDGVDAVQSGEVGQFQSSTLSTTVVGPGTLSFWSRASSSSTNHVFTYVNYLDFFLNGIHEARTPGYFQYGWQQQTFYLPAGSNLLSWVYSNNNSSTNGNAGWLDEVIFVPGGTAPFGVGVSYDRVPSWRGGLATFDAWTTGGTPPFVYQLFKNGDMVTSGDSSLLTLTNVQLSDAASTFSIRVTNDYGATILSNLSLYLTPIAYWGDNSAGQRHPPEGLSGVVKVSAGMYHSLALQANGTVAGWGDPYAAEVPMGLTNVVDIAAGEYHNLALLANGTVVAWGDNWAGQSDVPPSLNNVAAVAAGAGFSAALRANGTVVCWGEYDDGESLVLMTAPAGLNNITSIAAGYGHCLALRSNGTVVAWGDNAVGQTNVPTSLSNVVALAAGVYHNLALRSDGTIVGWGEPSDLGLTNSPVGASNVTAIATKYYHNLALRADGRVIAWGEDFDGQSSVPTSVTNAIAIAAGFRHSLALVEPSRPVILQQPHDLTVTTNSPAAFTVVASSSVPIAYKWYFNTNTLLPNATNASVIISNSQAANAGLYRVVLSNSFGSVTSSFARLTVVTVPSLTAVQAAGGLPQLQFTGTSGTFYDIEKSTNLVHWTFAGRVLVGDVVNLEQLDADWRMSPGAFFRVVLALSQQLLPPTIVKQPLGAVAPPGGAVRFSVLATGSFPFQYQWKFNGTNIAAATSSILMLTNVQVAQAGLYSVVITGPGGGTVSLDAQLYVQSEGIPNGDNFDDGVSDPQMWLPLFAWGAEYPMMVETNGRLEYIGTDFLAAQTWIGSQGRYDQDWEVLADVNLPNLALTQDSASVTLFMVIGHDDDEVMWEDTVRLTFDLSLDPPTDYHRYIGVWAVANEEETGLNELEALSTQAIFRVTFSTASKTLTAWVDEDGYANGVSWTELLSQRVDSQGADWGMVANSRFVIGLGAFAGSHTVNSGDGVFFDNFITIGGFLPP